MRQKPITPYQRLLTQMREAWNKVEYARTVTMFYFRKDRLDKGEDFRMDDVRERVMAAEQLGYEVVLEVKEGALYMLYRKKPPERPSVLR